MLSNINIATYLTNKLNEMGKEYEEEFKIHNGAGHIEGEDARKINGVLNQVGENYVNSKLNYINIIGQYEIELVVSVMSGFSRQEDIIRIVNKVITELNGVPISIAEGRAIFSFRIPKSGNLEVREAEGNSVVIRINFGIEYSEVDSEGVYYEMALIDNPFCGTINTRYFDTQEEQHAWYLNKIKNGGIPFSKTFTPNVNSLLLSKQTYINEQGLDTSTILMNNYAIIRSVKKGTPQYYYYYEVQNADLGANNQPVFDLKLDTLQTFYFDPNIEFSDCYIKRAHLKRFKPKTINGEVRYLFNFREDSSLFEREELKGLAKRPTVKKQLFPLLDTSGTGSEINNWFKDNISHWIYYFISGGKTYYFYKPSKSGIPNEYEIPNIKYNTGTDDKIDGNLVVLVAPIYKSQKRIKVRMDLTGASNEYYIPWTISAIKDFLNLDTTQGETKYSNNKFANVYSIKNSLMPPMSPKEMSLLMFIDDNGDLVLNSDEQSDMTGIRPFQSEIGFLTASPAGSTDTNGTDYVSDRCACGFMMEQKINNNIEMYIENNMYDAIFSYQDIITGKTTEWLLGIEPKILNEDFSTYRLLLGGNSYDLSISKTSTKPRFLYKEILSPDITKAMLIYNPNNSLYPSGIFSDINTKDFTGFMINADLSMWFTNDQLDTYLATNKNNLQIFNNQQSQSRESAFIGGISNITGSLITGGLAEISGNGLAGTISNSIQLLNNQRYETLNRSLTLNNMAQSPQSLSSLNSNALLMQSVDDFAIYIEMQMPLTHEQKIIIEDLKINGYSCNYMDNVKNVDNIRTHFNFVQAIIQSISNVSISNAIREDIRNKFAQGIRFWNMDKEDYSVSNYEKVL